jgi:hypothetical protein
MNTPKTCKQLWRDRENAWHSLWNRYHAEIGEARAREFPVGTKVKFSHGNKEVNGVVMELSSVFPDKIKVRNVNTGTVWDLEVQCLELAEKAK